MSENHDEQETRLTYPDETTNTIQLVVYNSDREQTTEPNIWREDITFTLVEQHSSSDKENDGGLIKVEEDIGISNSESQVLPIDVTPPPRTAERADWGTTMSSGTIQERTGFCLPLRQILEEGRPIHYRSFDHLRTIDEVFDRITYLSSISGILVKPTEKWCLAKLWILLKDDQFTLTLIKEARGKLNWHCAELLEVFTNIAKLEWFEQILPGNSIEQLGLDILCRLITADIEWFYQIVIQEREQYGEIPWSNNPMDLLFLKHLHLLTMIMPDHSHVTELLDEMHQKTQDLSFLIDQAHALTVQMKLATNWMTRLYQNGAEPVNFTTEQSSHVDHLLGHIESRDNSNLMCYHAANHHCIHCQGTHTSEDHHLSVSVPPVFNSGHIGLSPPLEQAQMTTFHNRPHNYRKNMRFSLPSQQSAFNAAQQCQQWPLPPKPTPPMMSRCSMPVTALSTSTRKSPISSITSHTSGNKKQSSSFSRKSMPASRHSDSSSRWLTTTLPSSTRSLRIHQSTMMSTGEKSPGDQCHNGNYHRCKMNDTSATQSVSHNNRHPSYNPHTDESNYDNNKTPDITDLYGEEVYNNID